MKPPLVPDALVERAARRLKVLGHPVRLRLLNALRAHGELSVQELMDLTEQRQANASKHLGLLAREGIVRRRKEGINAFYSIADPSIAGIYLLISNRLNEKAAEPDAAP
ncbi:MAG: metalloregulator ArsR/SmtB family transcription factor [Bacteroidota bacterium]